MAVMTKRFKAAEALVDRSKSYSIDEAMDIVARAPGAKFDESVDVSLRLGVDPKHADQMVRGAIVLPHGIGKTVRVAVFAKGEKEREAREAGADVVGAEDLVEKIQGGFMDFDSTIATPDLMGQVGRLGSTSRCACGTARFGTSDRADNWPQRKQPALCGHALVSRDRRGSPPSPDSHACGTGGNGRCTIPAGSMPTSGRSRRQRTGRR